jgi:hypothetical protein
MPLALLLVASLAGTGVAQTISDRLDYYPVRVAASF